MNFFKSALILGVAVSGLAVAGLANASSPDCGNEPGSKWQSMETMIKKVEEMGYKVREFEADDGCYEFEGTNADGQKVEVYLHPVTGDIVKTELDD